MSEITNNMPSHFRKRFILIPLTAPAQGARFDGVLEGLACCIGFGPSFLQRVIPFRLRIRVVNEHELWIMFQAALLEIHHIAILPQEGTGETA